MVNTVPFAIVDASYVLAFLIPDEWTTSVQSVFDAHKKGEILLTAPSILTYEVLNGLRMAVKRKRLDSERGRTLADDFSTFPITQESIDINEAYEMAIRFDLTIYDSSYLWLAKSKGISLYSLDKKLIGLAKMKTKIR